MRKCTPDQLKTLAKKLTQLNETVYSHTLYLLRKGKFWKGDPFLVYTNRNEWLPTGLNRNLDEIDYSEMLEQLEEWNKVNE